MSDPDLTDPGDRIGKLSIERIVAGAITCLRLGGIVDEQFDVRALLTGVPPGGTLILDLGAIERISSFGIREWVDFAAQAQARARAVYFVECAPKVIDQCNMVGNFTGGAAILSFYAPFRCDYCDDERRRLVQVDLEREAIRSGKLAEKPCEACGNPEYFDEDPLTFFSHLREQREAPVPPEVARFLAERLQFVPSDKQRALKIDKLVDGRATYVRLSGDLDAMLPREKLADGLEGEVVFDLEGIGRIDAAGGAEWKRMVQAVTPLVDKLRLTGCPPGFVERLCGATDLGPKCDVVSILVPYACESCRATRTQLIDVEQSWELVHHATAPERTCADCGARTTCAASQQLLGQLAGLPRPEIDAAVRAQLARFAERMAHPASAQPASLATPSLAAAPARPVWLWASLGGGVVAVAALAVALVAMRGGGQGAPATEQQVQASAPSAPPWLDGRPPREGDRVYFVGQAEPAPDQGAALAAADDAALDELAAQLGAKLDGDGAWRAARLKALGGLFRERQAAVAGGDGAELARIAREVEASRHAAAELLRRTGGGLVPAARADLYWEQRRGPNGTRFLAWSRFALPAAQVDALAARYQARVEAMGVRVAPLPPWRAWVGAAAEGALAAEVTRESPLAQAGVQAGDLVLAVDDRVVRDAPSWKRLVDEEAARLALAGGSLSVQLQRGRAAPFDARVPIAQAVAKSSPSGPRHGKRERGEHPPRSSVRGNVWDDNPDE